jgi:hypothetical protein
VVDDQPDASMPANLEARKADQSSGGRDHFECGRLIVPSLFSNPCTASFSISSNASWWDERKQRYNVLTIFGLANAEYDRLHGELLAVLRNG